MHYNEYEVIEIVKKLTIEHARNLDYNFGKSDNSSVFNDYIEKAIADGTLTKTEEMHEIYFIQEDGTIKTKMMNCEVYRLR